MHRFDPEEFVRTKVENLQKTIGDGKALVAVSGGVDSTTCAVLTRMAIGENLVCIIIDDAFMREREPERVAEILSKEPFNVPVKIVDARERFLKAMEGLMDAEEKRKKFREVFYTVLSEAAREEKCKFLVQGTIRADVVETVGGIKTQHNVLEQIGINPMEKFGFNVVEPLLTLFKGEVRMVAKYLGLPDELVKRQPFPGPGLSVRVVGEIRRDKLDALKKATTIVENALSIYDPSQYFAAIIDNKEAPSTQGKAEMQETVARFLNVPSRNIHVKIFNDKATGLKGGERCYGRIVGLKVETADGNIYKKALGNLVSVQAKIINSDPTVTRVLYAIKEVSENKPYVVSVRSVQTENFLTAQVSEIPWKILEETATRIIEKCMTVSTVYYDITPKPPATIEME